MIVYIADAFADKIIKQPRRKMSGQLYICAGFVINVSMFLH